MRIPLFRVHAFADRPFTGNPAAVCLLNSWLDDESLRKVAAENNLSATAFLLPQANTYELRWFTTICEIKLCGHATLAAGFVVLKLLQPKSQSVMFETRHGGMLEVRRHDQFFQMDFPALRPKRRSGTTEELMRALGLDRNPLELLEVNDTWIVVLDREESVAQAIPDFSLLESFHPFVVAITAPGNEADCVSRYFAPSYGVPEDPVTGSLHCALTPYWSERLGKATLQARQLSKSMGELWCEMAGDRVKLNGNAVLTMKGSLSI